jgi:predicted MFS family arabinose efflux permease
MKRVARIGRNLVVDVRPLRKSRDLRCLFGGQLVIMLGGQLTTVAVPYQVYSLTRSSLDVGLVSLAQLLPLIAGGVVGGALADAVDRRSLLLASQLLTALCAAGLAVNATVGTALWPLFVLPAAAAGCAVAGESGLSAMLPNLAGRSETATVNAMFQALLQVGQVAGPAVAGLLLAGVGVRFVYWLDAASVAVAMLATARMGRQRPAGTSHSPGLRSIVDGLRHLRGQPLIQGAFLIDINATVFGVPSAVFPALAFGVFHGGARTLGLLYAAPGAGALLGAVTTGWVHRVRRQGRAVIVAVIIWGAAIACFGLSHWLPVAFALLAVAGWADVVSAVFRGTIIQLAAPDALRGRLMGLQMAVVTAGPRIGDAESGAVASAFGATASVVSGGLACIGGALILARLLPAFSRQETSTAGEAELARAVGTGS